MCACHLVLRTERPLHCNALSPLSVWSLPLPCRPFPNQSQTQERITSALPYKFLCSPPASVVCMPNAPLGASPKWVKPRQILLPVGQCGHDPLHAPCRLRRQSPDQMNEPRTKVRHTSKVTRPHQLTSTQNPDKVTWRREGH